MPAELPPVAILAGGLATRLRPITERIAKAMVPVHGRPFIAYQLEQLREQGITEVVLLVGYRGEQVEEFVGDGSRFGLRARFVYDGPTLLGTAGAIRAALPLLGPSFYVLYGDSYLTVDYAAVHETLARSGKLAALTVLENEGKWDTSNVEFTDGVLIRHDKVNRTPAMRHIDYGLSLFRAEAFDRVPAGEPFDLSTLVGGLIEEGAVVGYEVFHRFYEIGSPEGLHSFEAFVSDRPVPQPHQTRRIAP
jgi:N-acetyl-alpha-D-muramate 1-phosphate uridylyltransferase